MLTHKELLPETASSHDNFVYFEPAHEEGRGRLLIQQGKHRSEYDIARFASEGGHTFRLHKLSGTDPEAGSYDVFVADRRGLFDSCECRGFLRHGHCKHTAAIRALLENRWV